MRHFLEDPQSVKTTSKSSLNSSQKSVSSSNKSLNGNKLFLHVYDIKSKQALIRMSESRAQNPKTHKNSRSEINKSCV